MHFSSKNPSRGWRRRKRARIIHIPGCICRFELGFCKNKKKRTETLYQSFSPFMAEKEGFEPSRQLSHPTPLAGEPLRPLGYFSTAYKKYLLGGERGIRTPGALRHHWFSRPAPSTTRPSLLANQLKEFYHIQSDLSIASLKEFYGLCRTTIDLGKVGKKKRDLRANLVSLSC